MNDRVGAVGGFLFLVVLGTDGTADAQDKDPLAGVPTASLSAVAMVTPSGPRPSEPFTLTLGSGYGHTESVLGMGDGHHRVKGALAIESALRPWLGLGLRLDGRYDRHSAPGVPDDDGWTGDPRVFARADHAVGAGTSIGARASLWLPGQHAPSITTSAVTPEILGLVSFAPDQSPWVLTANAGYRLDRSAKSAPDAATLSRADRLALGLSAFDAALLGLGALYRRGDLQLFAEWTWDVLLGAGAPSPGSSPMLLGGGLRYGLRRHAALEASVTVSPSARPSTAIDGPLVPVPPSFAITFGFVTWFGGQAPRPAAPVPVVAPPMPADAVEAPAPKAPSGQIRGSVRSFTGRPIDATVRVSPARPDVISAGEVREIRSKDGAFEIEVPPGPYNVTLEAPGYASQTRVVRVEENGVTVLNADLRRAQ